MKVLDFTKINEAAGVTSTARGTWGGQQPLLVSTHEGLFSAHITHAGSGEGVPHRDRFGEIICLGDGNDDNTQRYFSLLFNPIGTTKWHILGTWQHTIGPPSIMSDACGNVFVATYADLTIPHTQFNPDLPAFSRNIADIHLDPTVIKYTANSFVDEKSWSQDQLTVNVWQQMTPDWTLSNQRWDDKPHFWSRLSCSQYLTANISPDGIIYIVTGERYWQNKFGLTPNGSGHMEIVAFDTNTDEWKAGRVWTGIRYAYYYINFLPNKDNIGYDISIIGVRDDYRDFMGYSGFGPDWAFDGFDYWRISPEFPLRGEAFLSKGEISLPPANFNGWLPPHEAIIVKHTVLALADVAEHQKIQRQPTYRSNMQGDVFMDFGCDREGSLRDGEIHHLWRKQDISTDFNPVMYHMLIRDGEVVFNKPIFNDARNITMFKDSLNNYYILEGTGDTIFNLHIAVGFCDTGWTWQQYETFNIPLGTGMGGIANAYTKGVMGHGGDIVYIIGRAPDESYEFWVFTLDLGNPLL